jgi:hypothetical protein
MPHRHSRVGTALCQDLLRAVVLVAIHSHHMWGVPTPSVQMVLRLMQLLRLLVATMQLLRLLVATMQLLRLLVATMQLLRLLVATQLEKEQHMHLLRFRLQVWVTTQSAVMIVGVRGVSPTRQLYRVMSNLVTQIAVLLSPRTTRPCQSMHPLLGHRHHLCHLPLPTLRQQCQCRQGQCQHLHPP